MKKVNYRHYIFSGLVLVSLLLSVKKNQLLLGN